MGGEDVWVWECCGVLRVSLLVRDRQVTRYGSRRKVVRGSDKT